MNVAAVVILAAFVAVEAAHAAAIQIAWDPSPEQDVVGYRVYVGTASRTYTESFDVGQQTSFTYEGLSNTRYYFAVAAYRQGRVEGGLSEAVSAYTVDDPRTVPPEAPALFCPAVWSQDCYGVQQLVRTGEEMTSLTVLPDGRLLFLVGGRQVRVLAGDRLVPEPALEADVSERLTQIAVDPAFSSTGRIFVGRARLRHGGEHELDIVRYRLLQNRLGEGVVVIPGQPIDAAGAAPFAFDDRGHLYVALPSVPTRAPNRDPFRGMIRRYNLDGTVPPDSPAGSPILAHGYARPVALAWDAAERRLWLSGSDPRFPQPIAHLAVDQLRGQEWPHLPQPGFLSLSPVTEESELGLAVRNETLEVRLLFPLNVPRLAAPLLGRRAPRLAQIPAARLGAVTDIGRGAGGQIYIVVRTTRQWSAETFSLVKLLPVR